MSKRCELQKEYFKEYGNYKGGGKYNNHYVNWLENKVLALTLTSVVEPFYCRDESYHKIDRCKNQCSKCLGVDKQCKQ